MCGTRRLKICSTTYVAGNTNSNNSFTFPRNSGKCSLHLIQKPDHSSERNVRSYGLHRFGCRWDILGWWNRTRWLAGRKPFHPITFNAIQLSAWSTQWKDFERASNNSWRKRFFDSLVQPWKMMVGPTHRSKLPFSYPILFRYNLSWVRSVVLKGVDIDPQRSTGPFKGSMNSHGVEWGHWLTRESINNCSRAYWSNEASNSLLIGRGTQMAFFNKSSKIKRSDQISATVV